ncbi:MAG: hypothetical protein AB8I08_25735 [Sandaracinaceae bacterium]
MRTLAIVVAAWALTLTAGTVHAQVRVGDIRGPGGRALERRLPDALEAAGVRVEEDAPAELTGTARRRGRRLRLEATLRTGSREEPFEVTARSVRALVRDTANEVADRLGDAEPSEPEPIEAPPPESRPAPTSTATASTTAPSDEGAWAAPAMEYAVGLATLTRQQSFQDDLFDRVGEYGLPLAPAMSFSATWFPARHFVAHPLAGLGVTGRFFGACCVRSSTPDGETSFDTTIDELSLGLIYRVRLLEFLRVEGEFGVGQARFEVGAPGPASPGRARRPVPPARYVSLRPGLAVWIDLPLHLSLRAGAGFRSVVDSGALAYEQWFPGSSTLGWDASLEVRWRFDKWFAVRAYGQYTAYSTTIDPQPGDALVVAGASDEWTTFGAEFVVVLPGVPQ